jgi:hypothetical protein
MRNTPAHRSIGAACDQVAWSTFDGNAAMRGARAAKETVKETVKEHSTNSRVQRFEEPVRLFT